MGLGHVRQRLLGAFSISTVFDPAAASFSHYPRLLPNGSPCYTIQLPILDFDAGLEAYGKVTSQQSRYLRRRLEAGILLPLGFKQR